MADRDNIMSSSINSIDIEDEDILTTIFKDSFPENWQENPDFLQYLVELSSYGADRLSREPERLAEEKAQILSETQDLAFHNYTTFIQTADCSKEIFQDFQIIEQHVEGLLSKLPEMSTQCNHVVDKAQEISASRRMNSLTLQRHTQLLEVLEMPQLMDTCVRNGYTEEALELGSHVKRLEKKHGNIPVIASIVQEVKASTQLLLSQLIQQLRTNLQLPACLRIIGFLRRMDVFTEAELRITFLQARDAWFQSILEAIPRTDAYTHISKTIESSRVHLFDIMTQFRAIFSDEDPLVSSGRAEPISQSLIFHSWVLQKISQFLETLDHDLACGSGGRLDSVLGQCMYFGLSFSRVGADFRGLLAPVFERAALRDFNTALVDANRKFEENMQSYNLLGFTTTGGLPFGMASTQSSQLYPPTTLLDFYPLAAYCNHILTAFNDLRLCSPLTLAAKIAEELQRSLMEVNRVILAFHRAEETTFNAKEKDQFEQFCASYVTDLLPYVNKCLQALFPPQQIASALGLSVSEMNKKASLGQVNISTILSNIDHLMPAPPTPEPTPPSSEHGSQGQPVTFAVGSDDEDEDEETHGEDQGSNEAIVEEKREDEKSKNEDQSLGKPTVAKSEATPEKDSEQKDPIDINEKSSEVTTDKEDEAKSLPSEVGSPDDSSFKLETKKESVLSESVPAASGDVLETKNEESGLSESTSATSGDVSTEPSVEKDSSSTQEATTKEEISSDKDSASTSVAVTQDSGSTSIVETKDNASTSVSDSTLEVTSTNVSSGAATTTVDTSDADGWNTDGWNAEGFDLDNLDNVTIDPEAETVDLDLLPSPAKSKDKKKD